MAKNCGKPARTQTAIKRDEHSCSWTKLSAGNLSSADVKALLTGAGFLMQRNSRLLHAHQMQGMQGILISADNATDV